jgi:hypothetical protein
MGMGTYDLGGFPFCFMLNHSLCTGGRQGQRLNAVTASTSILRHAPLTDWELERDMM